MSKEISIHTRFVPGLESSGRHRFNVSDGHVIHAKMCIVVDPHDFAVRSTAVQPHRLGESIGQSAMQHNARGKNTKSQNPFKAGCMQYQIPRVTQ
jgi:hypothetical protein